MIVNQLNPKNIEVVVFAQKFLYNMLSGEAI
jgi:hypothetical protein